LRQDRKTGNGLISAVALAWFFTALFYFYQYVLRSAPAVMMPELTEAYGLTAGGIASLVGIFYYGYAIFSLVSGVAVDQLGPRNVVPLAAATVGFGALLFASGAPVLGGAGQFLQGAGGVFSLTGAVYIISKSFPVSRAATMIGATQMFGMAGGAAGQFLVGPAIAAGLPWHQFWFTMALAGFVLTGVLLFYIPPNKKKAARPANWAKDAASALATVFMNRQSLLCGLIAALLFFPTTIFDMVWGVRFLQEGHGVDYSLAVLRSASVPFGWIIGCPLLGALSDRIGRRKPVIIAGAAVLLGSLALILFGPPDTFPPYSLGLLVGIASGAAMLPYTVIKEANRPEHGGTATGVINFINFSLTALLGPVLARVLMHVSAGGERQLVHYQAAFQPLLYGVALAILLTLFLRETGPGRAAASGGSPNTAAPADGRTATSP